MQGWSADEQLPCVFQLKECASVAFRRAHEMPHNVVCRGFETRVSAQFRKHALCSEPTGGLSLEFIAMRSKYAPLSENFIGNTFSMVSHQIGLPSAKDHGVEMAIFDMSKSGNAIYCTIRYF